MNVDDAHGEHEMDRWIDDAVSRYGKAEPHAGLEGRVLARLAEARRESSRTRRWWSALAFSAAVILALMLVWQQRTTPTHIPANPVAKVATPPRTEEHAADSKRALDENTKSGRETYSLALVRNKSNQRALGVAAAQNAPKLEQFPAPQPLNEQERLLARYVQEFPQKAALVARAQTELRKQDELEMAAPWPNATATSFEQQE
jgi:hypothetical protein